LPKGRFVIEPGAALVETDDGRLEVRRNVAIIVNGDTIEDIMDRDELQKDDLMASMASLRRVSIPGDLLLPGLISGHTHACSATPTRGIFEVAGRTYTRPLQLVETLLSDEELDALTAFNVAELLLSGCTTHVEMSLSLRQAESYVRVAERWGVRGFPGAMVPGISRLFPIWFRGDDQILLNSEPGTLAEIADNLAFAKRHMGKGNGRIIPMTTLHASDTHTPATLTACASAATELGTGIHMHLAQIPIEPKSVQRMWEMSPAQFVASHGLMDGPFFGAHMSGVDFGKDGSLLKEKGVVYAHCPSAGGAGGSSQPFPEALAVGVKVNIGIDTHSNDYLENLKLSVIVGQARYHLLAASGREVKSPTIWDAIEGATRIAADGLRRKDLGRIRKGAKADLVSVDVSGFLVGTGSFPPEPLNNLLYANGKSVRHVTTDGVFQVWDGTLVCDDPRLVAEKGGAVVKKIWDKLEEEGWFTPDPR
jgi:cytosine/adenosine deaminase-related metal-dependent hydrolase